MKIELTDDELMLIQDALDFMIERRYEDLDCFDEETEADTYAALTEDITNCNKVIDVLNAQEKGA